MNTAQKDIGELSRFEWLETNGIGGYASGTISGANTRRYHGLLTASLHPPVDRRVLLSKLDETIVRKNETYELASNFFPGAIWPDGFRYLRSFQRELFPVFQYEVNDIRITKTIVAVHGENTTLVMYKVDDAMESFELELNVLASGRDYHSLSHANDAICRKASFQDGILSFRSYANQPEVFVFLPESSFKPSGEWYYRFEYPVEAYRGLDHHEDLYCYGKLCINLNKGDQIGIIISTDQPGSRNAFRLYDKEVRRRLKLHPESAQDPMLKRLFLAADQFIVKRGNDSNTIIAGYPWFTDWGRDTMIALPGLCLPTGRYEEAKSILRSFSEHVSQGMLPNRFPDTGEEVEYNTIDASLWFFVAIFEYYQASKDGSVCDLFLDAMRQIISWHHKGTRFQIKMDEDYLLRGGEAGYQLTWMDARVGNWVVTPRVGKPVEINALWYNAHCIYAYFLKEFGDLHEARRVKSIADKIKTRFQEVFWNEDAGCLYDYVDDHYKNNDVRPNQIYAISLPFKVVDSAMAAKIFSKVTNELLTPRGLRSLAPGNPDFKSVYGGNQWERDGAYHQGTVWSFLIGPYIDALFVVKKDKAIERAEKIVHNFLMHLDEACVGQISEIFDATAPFTPRGCFAQAWGVGEILRVIFRYQLFGARRTQ